jgi:putative ABC transport system permease protein
MCDYIVVTRLIGLQREQIAVLKAFGYRDLDVGIHYVKMVLVIAVLGTVGGTLLGAWAGQAMGTLYLEYFHFPFLDYTLRPTVVLTAVLLTTGASVVGVLRSVRRAARLPPAEAMRPPPPARYRETFVERMGLHHALDQPTRIILRNLERQPIKAALTTVGIASACAILITGLFFVDVIDHVVRIQFGLAQREDVTVSFVEPTSRSALHELRALPGVQHAEPFRSVPVRLRHGHRSYDTAIEGIPAGAYLRRVIDTDLRPIPIPPQGIMLTTQLGDLLRARPGDEVVVEVMEGRRRTRAVTVAGLAEQYIGVGAYMELATLNRLVGEGQAISGAYLLIDDGRGAELNRALRDRPAVASIVAQDRAVEAYLDTAAETILVFMGILTLFAGVIAFGVVYNSMRIALSERDRELASMRVLGFRRREVAYILLGEAAVLVLAAIPLGFLMGVGLAHLTVAGLQSDMFAFPVVFSRSTFGLAAAVVLASALLSAILVRRQVNRLDLIGVLKTRE